MWGGCPARAPPRREPDRNRSHLAKRGKVHHQESCGDLMGSSSRGNGQPGTPLHPCPARPIAISSASAPASLFPWIPICSGKPGSRSGPQVPWLGRRCLTPAPGGGSSLPHLRGEQPPVHAAMGARQSAVLSWIPVLGDGLRPACSDRLRGSEPLSTGVGWQCFSLTASTIGPPYILCGRRRGR